MRHTHKKAPKEWNRKKGEYYNIIIWFNFNVYSNIPPSGARHRTHKSQWPGTIQNLFLKHVVSYIFSVNSTLTFECDLLIARRSCEKEKKNKSCSCTEWKKKILYFLWLPQFCNILCGRSGQWMNLFGLSYRSPLPVCTDGRWVGPNIW